MTKPRTQKERSEHTTSSVLEIAQKHFADLGYSGVSTETMLGEAGLTRGALYHHFGNKQGLFEAVVKHIQTELVEAVLVNSRKEADPWKSFIAGCNAWLEQATKPETQKILLIDAPSVLGWERWQKLDGEAGARLLREGIQSLKKAGLIKMTSEDALLHLLNGAMNEAALWVAQSSKPKQALKEAKVTLAALLEGIRK